MQQTASFYFHASLNDFLPARKRGRWISYSFQDRPALKDAIEAIGVPHPEVAALLVNRQATAFLHPLKDKDQVEVYPAAHSLQLPQEYKLRPAYQGKKRFVADVHLGKLSRQLRMLGFDCLYKNDYSDQIIATIAEQENRIVLSRDLGLLRLKTIYWGYWLRSQEPEEQLKEVVHYFHLEHKMNPLSRCIACNGKIEPVPKVEVMEALPQGTRQHFEEFFQCEACRKIYWKGSHFERMQEFIGRIKEKERKDQQRL